MTSRLSTSSPLSAASPTPRTRPSSRAALSVREWRRWRRDGFFVRRDVFAEPTLELLRNAVDRVGALATTWLDRGVNYEVDGRRFLDVGPTTLQYERSDPPEVAVTPRVLEPAHHLDTDLDAVVDDPRLVAPVRELVGSPRISLFTDKLNFKRPRVGSAFRWHQDSPYWAEQPGVWERIERLPNVLIQLDASDQSNGCIRVFRGTHRAGVLPGIRDGSALGPLFTDPANLDAGAVRTLALAAGSVLFFHPHLVHGSEANRSGRPRRASVLTYQASGHRMFKLDRIREVASPGV